MKKFCFIFIALSFLAVGLFAQENENDQKPGGGRIAVLKIAYISKQLNLTPEEAQRFWPVYNQYEGEIKRVRLDAIQNKEAEIATEEKILNIRKKYNGEFVKALSPQRADQFYKCEKEFGAFISRELIQRRQMRMQQRHPNLRP